VEGREGMEKKSFVTKQLVYIFRSGTRTGTRVVGMSNIPYKRWRSLPTIVA